MDAGIQVEITRSEAPRELAIAPTDLCSLIINIINNAVKAASESGSEPPYLKLDIHTKGSWLSISCENSADITRIEDKKNDVLLPRHGLGLKIIERIVQQYGGLSNTEYGSNYYKI